MTKVEMPSEEKIKQFMEENEGKTADEMIEDLAVHILETQPDALKESMRKAGYDVDNMKCFDTGKFDET